MRGNEGIVEITSEAELRGMIGEPMERAVKKVHQRLHPHHRSWIAEAPFCVVGTAGGDGTCDISPKGDPAGFVHVLGDATIVLPDRPGNRRVDSFLNVLANPHVALLFLVPGRDETLRVNGRARLIREAPFFDDLVVNGHRPRLALLIEIDEVFFHCPKAFKRSGLWDAQSWGDPGRLPSLPRITKDTMDIPESVSDLERYYGPDYHKQLYARE